MSQTADQTPASGSKPTKNRPKIVGGILAFLVVAVGLAFSFTSGMGGCGKTT